MMVDVNLSIEYHGYPIIYNEGTSRFQGYVDGRVAFESPALKEVKIQIDAFEKAQIKKDFKRFGVLILKYGRYPTPDSFIEGEVTSITEDGDYWISGEKRSKEISVIPLTESNKQKTDKITELKTKIIQIQNEINQIEVSIERLTKGQRPPNNKE